MSKKLTVLFDANPLVNGNKSGVGYYSFYLISALAKNYPNDVQLIGHYFSFLGRKDKAALPQADNITYKKSRLIPGKIISVCRALGFQPPLELFFRRRGDAALFTNFVCLPSIFKTPRLTAVHDLCYIDLPDYVSEKNRNFLIKFVPKALKMSSKIITISKFTKKMVQKNYGTPESKFLLTPIPPAEKLPSNGFDLSSIGVDGKFMLLISTLEPRKNVINLAKAYEKLSQQQRDEYSLVLAGGMGWYMEETMSYIQALQKRGYKIITPGYISDDCRAALYENASLFVMPSHYEGFGMPILEAMSYGVPTAVSDISVFHEVAKDASVYFDKDDVGSMARVIGNVLDDKDLQKELISKGRQHLKSYDWEIVATDLYNSIVDVTS